MERLLRVGHATDISRPLFKATEVLFFFFWLSCCLTDNNNFQGFLKRKKQIAGFKLTLTHAEVRLVKLC